MKMLQDRSMTIGLAGFMLTASNLAFADQLDFGGGPGAGMAGAGLALPAYVGRNNVLNPALLGFARHGIDLAWPSFGYHTEGISVSQLRDQFGSINSGGLSNSKIQSFGKTDVDGVKEFGANAGLGLTAYGFGINGVAEADVTTIPNQALQTWSKNGASLSDPTVLNGQLDAYGLAYSQESLGYGDALKIGSDTISVGAAVKVVQAYYAHKIVSGYSVNGTTLSNSAVDGLDITGSGGTGNVQKNGTGLDLGFVYNPGSYKSVFVGGVVENLIQPNIKFDRQLPGSPSTPGGLLAQSIEPFRRAADVGLGWVPTSKLHVAADWVDLGNNAGRQELRLGADQFLLPGISARAGLSSYSGFELGISIHGFSVAYGSRTRLSVTTSYHF